MCVIVSPFLEMMIVTHLTCVTSGAPVQCVPRHHLEDISGYKVQDSGVSAAFIILDLSSCYLGLSVQVEVWADTYHKAEAGNVDKERFGPGMLKTIRLYKVDPTVPHQLWIEVVIKDQRRGSEFRDTLLYMYKVPATSNKMTITVVFIGLAVMVILIGLAGLILWKRNGICLNVSQ